MDSNTGADNSSFGIKILEIFAFLVIIILLIVIIFLTYNYTSKGDKNVVPEKIIEQVPIKQNIDVIPDKQVQPINIINIVPPIQSQEIIENKPYLGSTTELAQSPEVADQKPMQPADIPTDQKPMQPADIPIDQKPMQPADIPTDQKPMQPTTPQTISNFRANNFAHYKSQTLSYNLPITFNAQKNNKQSKLLMKEYAGNSYDYLQNDICI